MRDSPRKRGVLEANSSFGDSLHPGHWRLPSALAPSLPSDGGGLAGWRPSPATVVSLLCSVCAFISHKRLMDPRHHSGQQVAPAFFSHSGGSHAYRDPLRAFERVYAGAVSGFEQLVAQERAAQCWNEANNQGPAALSQAIVPAPGSHEFRLWSTQFGALTDTSVGYIDELFAARARAAIRRLQVIKAHLIHGHPFEPPAVIEPMYVDTPHQPLAIMPPSNTRL